MIEVYTWPTPNLGRWLRAVEERPAVGRGLELLAGHRRKTATMNAETHENLFGDTPF